ncbi:C80 family cysteine peptidase, partial [Burkholderia ambifaria]|uniref:C80 family cysteine peptidase n=1 Tax=Burkholderia ambifaria TaxID=152480 RepID=UPI001ABBAD3A
QTWNANASVGAAVGVNQTVDPVFGVIANPTFSVGVQGSHGWDDSRSTVKQAGIDARQSLTADLKGDVNLVGGHLVSQSGAGSVKVGGQVKAIDVVDQRHKDGNSGGGTIGIKSDGLATASFSYGKDDQVHRMEVQHGTIAVNDLQVAGGISGPLNRDAAQLSTLTDDRKIAGSKMTVEVGDLVEHIKGRLKSKSSAGDTQAGEESSGEARQARRAAPDDAAQPARRADHPVVAEPAEGTADRYTQRVIVQQGDDAVTAQAAKNLANKHPENTTLVKAGPDGKLAGLEQIAATGGKVKVQVVGHGDVEGGKLGGADAPTLARQTAQVKAQLGEDAKVEKVTLVGCQTGCVAAQVQEMLGTEVDKVTGRDGYVKVDQDGHKLDTVANDKNALINLDKLDKAAKASRDYLPIRTNQIDSTSAEAIVKLGEDRANPEMSEKRTYGAPHGIEDIISSGVGNCGECAAVTMGAVIAHEALDPSDAVSIMSGKNIDHAYTKIESVNNMAPSQIIDTWPNEIYLGPTGSHTLSSEGDYVITRIERSMDGNLAAIKPGNNPVEVVKWNDLVSNYRDAITKGLDERQNNMDWSLDSEVGNSIISEHPHLYRQRTARQ